MVSLKGHRVYLDASAVIYAVEGFEVYSGLESGLLAPMDRGEIQCETSELTVLEALVGPRKVGNERAEWAVRQFLTPGVSLELGPVSLEVLELAVDLRARLGFRAPDAIHLATGKLLECDLYLTGDRQWARAGVAIVDPRLVTGE